MQQQLAEIGPRRRLRAGSREHGNEEQRVQAEEHQQVDAHGRRGGHEAAESRIRGVCIAVTA